MLPELSLLLKYKHEKVIQAYIRNYNCPDETAQKLFENMLKYLWIARKHDADKKSNPQQGELDFLLVMHEEMRDIDNMWHNFILYTHDYTAFCLQYFGEYLHHVPDMNDVIQQTNDEFADSLEKYLSYVYDNLGEETVLSWFSMHLETTHAA